MEYIIEVLMRFEPSLQLKTRTTPSNQESFATRPTTSNPTDAEYVEYVTSLQVLLQDEIVEIDAAEKKNTKLHYNSKQNLVNLPAIVGSSGCLNWIALRTRPDIAWDTSQATSLITHDPETCFIESSIYVNIFIIHWAMRCDMFQFLHSRNTSCGCWEMPPLL